MQTLFLINPRSGQGRGLRLWRRIADRVATVPGCVDTMPVDRQETRKIAAQAVQRGVERLVVVGGDGTVNIVADQLAGSNTVLGVIPAGTGNDFCRNAGIPLGLNAALTMAFGHSTQRVDLGRLNGHSYFVNAAGIGFDAQVAHATASSGWKFGGTLPYLAGALSTLRWYRPAEIELRVDQERYCGPAMLVAVANGRCYGGGMKIAPMALTDDGYLDVCVVTGATRMEMLGLLGRVYSGEHIHHSKVRFFRGKKVRLSSETPVPAHLDGEPVEATSLAFDVYQGALNVLMPPRGRSTPLECDLSQEHLSELANRRYGTADSLFWWDH